MPSKETNPRPVVVKDLNDIPRYPVHVNYIDAFSAGINGIAIGFSISNVISRDTLWPMSVLVDILVGSSVFIYGSYLSKRITRERRARFESEPIVVFENK